MADDDNNLLRYHCPVCGVAYGLDKAVDKLWRAGHKTFMCPNGHSLSYKDQSESEKELVSLRSKVKELESKLQVAQKEAGDYKKKVEELTEELEIWRPSGTVFVRNDSKGN